METEILILKINQARLDHMTLQRAQEIAHTYWLKTERNERGQWAIVGKKLQEAITDTEREIRKLEKGD